MHTYLCITVRWIFDRFHGFIAGTETPEWPPSPFRLFQALLAGAHRFGPTESMNTALSWLESQAAPPDIVAQAKPASGIIFGHYVPDNDNSLQHRRSGIRKFCPLLFEGTPVVHYLWPLLSNGQPPIDALDELVSTLSSFGWAIDQAYASIELTDAQSFDKQQLARFQAGPKTTDAMQSLRVPVEGSAQDLRQVHSDNFTAFSEQGKRRGRRLPKVFNRVLYSSTERPIGLPNVVFKLFDENDDAYRYPHAKLIHIAGMLRHVAIEAMKHNPPPWKRDEPDWLQTFVCGHQGTSSKHQQLSYIPLPSIGHEHADALIRNVMIVAPIGCERELEYVAEQIDGRRLVPEHEVKPADGAANRAEPQAIFLQRFSPPAGRFISKYYLCQCRCWESVTPVILDGHTKKTKADRPDQIAATTARLICKALERAGIEAPCEFQWRTIPFFKNTLSGHKYNRNGHHTGYHRPSHLKDLSAIHVRLEFQHPVCGPIAIGAGRHCGFGLMAGVDQ